MSYDNPTLVHQSNPAFVPASNQSYANQILATGVQVSLSSTTVVQQDLSDPTNPGTAITYTTSQQGFGILNLGNKFGNSPSNSLGRLYVYTPGNGTAIADIATGNASGELQGSNQVRPGDTHCIIDGGGAADFSVWDINQDENTPPVLKSTRSWGDTFCRAPIIDLVNHLAIMFGRGGEYFMYRDTSAGNYTDWSAVVNGNGAINVGGTARICGNSDVDPINRVAVGCYDDYQNPVVITYNSDGTVVTAGILNTGLTVTGTVWDSVHHLGETFWFFLSDSYSYVLDITNHNTFTVVWSSNTGLFANSSVRSAKVFNNHAYIYDASTLYVYDLQVNAPPNAPILVSPIDLSRYNRAKSLLIDWDINDPDLGDTQSAYAIRRTINGVIEYWDEDLTAWVGTEKKNISTTTQATVTSWSNSREDVLFAVKTWDASDEVGPYSSDITVTPQSYIKTYDGGSFVEKPVSHYDGTQFSNGALKKWNGSSWELV